MNQRSNKKRSTSNRGGRGKGVERQLSVEGVYANHRFMQSVGTLVGLPIQVSTKTKEVFEGVFTTFGPNFDLVLDLPHVVSSGETSVITNPESIKRKMIFSAQDIVVIKVINVDPEYAARDSFAVDNVISKYNGQVQTEKELEPWHGDDSSYSSDLGLGDGNANGWDANEMFKKNKEKYGVTTTYSPEMEGYTTPLQKKNTKEWKEQEAKAHQIALEIEHSPMAQTRAELENGEDEEEKFSAVMRPDQGSSTGKYMPPQKRKTQSGISNKQPPSRGSPSPQSGGGPPMPGGGRYNSHSGPPPAPPSSSSSSSSSSLSSSSSSYTNNSTQSSSMPSSASGPMMGSPYSHHQNQMKLPHKHSAPQPPSGGPLQHSIQGDPKLNGDAKDPRKHESSPSYMRGEAPPNKEGFHPPDHGHSPRPHPHSHPHPHHPPPHQPPPQQQQQQGPPPPHSYQSHSQSFHSDARRPPPEPRGQRESRKPRNPKEEQQMADLKKFGEDFKLSDNGDKKSGPPPTAPPHHPHAVPSMPTMPKHHTHQMPPPPPAQAPVSQPTPSQPPPHQQQQQQQQPPLPPPQHPSAAPEPVSGSGSSSSSSGSTNNSSSAGLPPPQQAPPPHSSSVTATEGKVLAEEEKMNSTVSASKLNPNAKEFVFNPNAKPFSPRSPSTTTPPRAQTPQIVPQPSQMGSGGVQSVAFPPNMVHAYIMATQPFPGQSQPRFPKRGPVGNQRPDYTPSMQVAAATGHPILAPAPLTPITSQQTIPAVQLPQNIMPQTPQPYQYQGMPMMLRFPPPGIPMVTTMVPTSMGMCYQGTAEGHQNSQGHTPQHMYVTQGIPPHQASQPHPAGTPGAHPGQPPTPQGHNSGGGAPPPNMPAQPPTPGPTPPQAMMYSSHTGAPMGGQPTIPQHLPQHSPHTAQSPHNIYSGHNAALAAAAVSHHPPAQLVMIPPHMMPPGAPPPHSGTGHVPSSAAGYTPTSSAAMQHLNHGHPVHYIPGAAGSQMHSLPLVHHHHN